MVTHLDASRAEVAARRHAAAIRAVARRLSQRQAELEPVRELYKLAAAEKERVCLPRAAASSTSRRPSTAPSGRGLREEQDDDAENAPPP